MTLPENSITEMDDEKIIIYIKKIALINTPAIFKKNASIRLKILELITYCMSGNETAKK